MSVASSYARDETRSLAASSTSIAGFDADARDFVLRVEA